MSNDDKQSWDESAITRRQVLQGALVGGMTLSAGGLLAACGGGGGGGGSGAKTGNSGGTSAEGARTGGNLRVGVQGGGAKDSIDAHVLTTDPDIARAFQLYEPLAIRNPNYELEMVLAESIEAGKRPDVWTVRLKPDITFHDGKPVSADDVLFTLQRILDPKNPKTGAASISYVDVKRSRKVDDRTVEIHLKEPNTGFPDDIGQYFNGIVPTGYDPKKPIGTGPFKYQSFSPGQRSVFVKNPNYWRKGEPKLDQVVIIDFPDDTARVNALLGGQVDAISNLPAAQIAQVEGNSALKVLTSETGAWQPFTMRVDQAPFSDVKVRQAMRLIADRQQLIQQALSGQARVANDLYSPFDPAYDKDLPQRHQDLAQAKSLLKQAGQSDLRVQLVTSSVFQGIVEAAQVLAQQAKGAGVTINVRKVDTGTFYGDSYLKWPFAQDFWFTRTYLGQVAQGSLKESPFNETHWNNPQFTKLITQARAELDEAKRTELLKEAQKLEYDEGGYIVWSFSNQVDAYSAKVAGFQPAKSGVPLTNYGFGKVGFVAA
ncbi:MAG TPA: ABC transporter substrate-binding protein [Thermoleophilaceae bacterium]|nr:ABC transporter substrate-binding protein [Thermoleophilaceae bacterium]